MEYSVCLLSQSVLRSGSVLTFPLLNFCLDDLAIADGDVLMFPTIVVLLSISPLRSVINCLIYRETYFRYKDTQSENEKIVDRLCKW